MITAEQMQLLGQMAERVYRAGVCPPDHRSADTTFAVMLAGYEMGFEPMQSIRLLQVVKGRVSPTADATVGLVARSSACRYFRCAESTATQAVYETHREGHPEPARLVYTIQQAQRAQLTGSQTWKAHPEAMLRARCAAALARQVYPDLVAGIYSADEIAEIAASDDHASAPAASAPAPAPAVPDAITRAATCTDAARAYAEAVRGTDPSDTTLAAWRAECLAAAQRACADHGVVLSQGGLRVVATTPALAALCDEALALVTAGRREVLPGWWIQGEAAIAALADAPRRALETLCSRLWRGLCDPGDAEACTAASTAWRAEVDALRGQGRAREPGDDDDTPPQGPTRGRRSTVTAQGTGAASQGADGAVAWLASDDAAMAHAVSWSHARHVEASVRRHGHGLTGPAAERLVRVAAARMEALTADADGTRLTAEGLRRMAARWAAEGPVAARRAA